MELNEIMRSRVFTVLGDTLNEEKYAYRIKHALKDAGYTVHCVGKELASLNDVPEEEIEVLDLCINPVRGLAMIRECRKQIRVVLIQPGAGSDEIRQYLDQKNIPWLDGCALKALEAIKSSCYD